MLESGTLQMEFFEEPLGEVIVPSTEEAEGNSGGRLMGELPPAAASVMAAPDTELAPRRERFILRRNPVRQAEIAASRARKQQALDKSVSGLNTYLAEHPRAKVSTAQRRLEQRLKTLGLSNWMSVQSQERTITLREDPGAREEESKLDGCDVLRTDLSAEQASKETVHERYKSLGEVERAFRRSKTVELEMRPVHVRKESSTRGHLLVVMLAYRLLKELGKRRAHLDLTVKEGLDRLNTYCAVEIAGVVKVMLQPRADVQSLMTAAGVTLPTLLPGSKRKVATKKKLPKSRPTRLK